MFVSVDFSLSALFRITRSGRCRMDCHNLRVRKHYQWVYALQLQIVEMYAVIIIALASHAFPIPVPAGVHSHLICKHIWRNWCYTNDDRLQISWKWKKNLTKFKWDIMQHRARIAVILKLFHLNRWCLFIPYHTTTLITRSQSELCEWSAPLGISFP